MNNKINKKEIIVSTVGNALVWYNFALFMPFLFILSKKFVYVDNQNYKAIITFLMMSSALFFRPVGSTIFGPIGDRIGREKAISLAVLLMAGSTFCMGLLPSYDQIGIAAPIILVILRIFQGISMGGEYTAAMVHLVEIAPGNRRGMLGSFAEGSGQLGTAIAGTALILLYIFFSEEQIYDFAWRIPFFFSILLIPFAFMHNHPKSSKPSLEKDGIFKMLLGCKKAVFGNAPQK